MLSLLATDKRAEKNPILAAGSAACTGSWG
jgi:hypothetical protein